MKKPVFYWEFSCYESASFSREDPAWPVNSVELEKKGGVEMYGTRLASTWLRIAANSCCAALLIILSAGCGGGGTSSPPPPPPPPPPAPAAPPAFSPPPRASRHTAP